MAFAYTVTLLGSPIRYVFDPTIVDAIDPTMVDACHRNVEQQKIPP